MHWVSPFSLYSYNKRKQNKCQPLISIKSKLNWEIVDRFLHSQIRPSHSHYMAILTACSKPQAPCLRAVLVEVLPCVNHINYPTPCPSMGGPTLHDTCYSSAAYQGSAPAAPHGSGLVPAAQSPASSWSRSRSIPYRSLQYPCCR